MGKHQLGRHVYLSGGNPTWYDITPQDVSGAPYGYTEGFALDPADPDNRAWLVGSNGIWYTDQLAHVT
jgi:hypothetical protein